jgi:DNA-binding protein
VTINFLAFQSSILVNPQKYIFIRRRIQLGTNDEGLHLSESKENVVLVGSKPVMNYVVACITLFNSGLDEITVKARGRAVSHAVDCVGLLGRAFVKDLAVKDIKIGTEEIERYEGGKTNVSTIDMVISKGGEASNE